MDLKGTEGNDHLLGTADDDTLTGLGGDDVLEGGGGHDELDGGAGNDSLAGGDSYDYLVGGLGNDTLDGGADSDWVFYDRASGAVNVNLATGQVSGADGNDVLRNIEQVSGSAFNDVLVGDAGGNTLIGGAGDDTIDGGAGVDSTAYWGASGPITVNLATGQVSGAEGNDRLVNIENVDGTGFNDVLIGDAHDNTLYGRDGNDTLTGGGGHDSFILATGAGVDRITDLGNGDVLQFGAGELAADILSGDDASKLLSGQVMLGAAVQGVTRMYVGVDATPGADVVVELVGSFSVGEFTTQNTAYGAVLYDTALNQPQTLVGTAGDDQLQGGNRDDSLSGLAGDDNLSGGNGNDTLDGGDGYDSLYGGYGNDVLRGGAGGDYLVGGAGDDTIDGGADEDTVFYNGATGGVNVNLASGIASGADGNDRLSNIEHIYGSAFNDVLTGDAKDNSLNGRTGDDTLVGSAGSDRAIYWDANGPVNVNLAAGKASGADGNDQLSGIEGVVGSNYNDVLVGDALDNVLMGNGGQDTLTGGAGADTFGFYGSDPQEVDRVTDLGAGDMLAFDAGELAPILLSGDNAAGLLRGQVMVGTPNGGITRLYVGVDDQAGADRVVELVGSFSAGDFMPRSDAGGSLVYDPSLNQARNLTGTAGDDMLQGGNRDDLLSGLGGNDLLLGGNGNDTLDGGDGYDSLEGGAGNDLLRAGDGGDYLTGGLGNDTLDGGSGEDLAQYWNASGPVNVNLATGRASGAEGDDVLVGIENVYGSAFDDQLTGDAGANTFLGGLGNDTLVGGAGQDLAQYWDASGPVNVNLATGRASGACGNDQLSGIENLEGSGYDDVLVGDGQANVLTGGSGHDTLSGGSAADTFLLRGENADDVDTITDLGDGDVLQFTGGVLSFAILTGDDASKLTQGQVMVGTPVNGVTRLYVGLDDKVGADVVVNLVGNHAATEFSTEFAPWGAVLFDSALNQPHVLTGTDADDTLRGGNRDDTLTGGKGYDDLRGSAGNDLLRGGDDSDYLTGGTGNDTLDGGEGNDSAFYSNAAGPVSVNLATGRASGADGNDVLISIEQVYGSDFADSLTGDDEDNTLNGHAGNDTLSGGAGVDLAAYWDARDGVVVNLATGKASGGDGNDVLVSIEEVYGSYWDDQITGDAGDNRLSGNGGEDSIAGGAGADWLVGDAGNDTLAGGDGDDILQGDDGNDSLDGGAGFDTVYFNGPESNYVITVLGPGAWRVEDKVGSDGVDLLSSIESLSFVIVGNLDGSTLQGGSGYDIASYQTATSAVTVDLGAGTATGTKGSNALTSIEGAIGSANFGDTLLGNASDNQLSGLGGDDKLDGGDGSDKLDGGLGADVLTGGAGADTYIVDNAGDQVVEVANVATPGTTGNQDQGLGIAGSVDKVIASINYTLTNFVENLDLAQAAGNLSGNGNALNNVLVGNEGNNSLMGAGGNDTLDGRDGTDTAVYSGARASYQLLRTSSGVTVGATSGSDGTDSLSNIERLRFADQSLALDLGATQAAGKAVLMMAATLGVGFTASTSWAAAFLRYFDSGASLLDGATLLVEAGIVSAFAGGSDNTSFVKFVYGNVYGQAPDAATLAALVAPLNQHSFTQAQWMADVAQSAAAQQHVNLTGLAQSGWAYDTM